MDTQQDYQNALLGTRARKRIFIPNTKPSIEIELRVLSVQDAIDGQAAKHAYLEARQLLSNQSSNNIEENVQAIYRAALVPDTDRKFFSHPDNVREMSQEHLIYIGEQYSILANASNPNLTDISEEEIERLKKKLLNGEELISLNYFQLQSLCRHLADSLSASTQPAMSSSTAPQTDSPTPNGTSTGASTDTSEMSSRSRLRSQTPVAVTEEKTPSSTTGSSQTKEASSPQTSEKN